MKNILEQVLEAPPADAEGQPVIGIVVASLGALAIWGGIVGFISLIV